MKTKTACIAVALLASAPAFAGNDTIADLSQASGLSERHVQMILGNRTPFAEYRYVYNRKLKQFKQTIGEVEYERLISGQPVTLTIGGERRIVQLTGREGARAL